VAARNSCTGPWQPSFDLQLSWRPAGFGLERRLTVSVLTVNLMGGLDEWLHGAARLHGWGYAAAPDPVLLYVRGFDPATARFRYTVNGRFGASSAGNGGVTVPFQIGLQARLTLGPNRMRARLPGLMAIRDSGLARAIPALALEQGGVGAELVLCGYHPGARATLDARVGQRRFAIKTFADDPAPEAALYQALGAAGLAGGSGA